MKSEELSVPEVFSLESNRGARSDNPSIPMSSPLIVLQAFEKEGFSRSPAYYGLAE